MSSVSRGKLSIGGGWSNNMNVNVNMNGDNSNNIHHTNRNHNTLTLKSMIMNPLTVASSSVIGAVSNNR